VPRESPPGSSPLADDPDRDIAACADLGGQGDADPTGRVAPSMLLAPITRVGIPGVEKGVAARKAVSSGEHLRHQELGIDPAEKNTRCHDGSGRPCRPHASRGRFPPGSPLDRGRDGRIFLPGEVRDPLIRSRTRRSCHTPRVQVAGSLGPGVEAAAFRLEAIAWSCLSAGEPDPDTGV
jgi:hypothetical protein